MKPLPIKEIAAAVGAEYCGEPADISAVSTDTRALPPGCLFVALRGERFDGNQYVRQALEDGAAFAAAEEMPPDVPREQVLLVPDGRQALLEIAGLYRRSLDLRVIGITGSVGKTTTKEMVACVMQSAFPTLKTPENLNNEIGLSQTILTLEEEHRIAVLEMGIDGPGQMQAMSACAAPDLGILTNIGVSHIRQFGSQAGILEEKLRFLQASPSAPLIVNADDPMLAAISDTNHRVLRYGIQAEDVAVRAGRIREYSTHTTFEIVYDGNRFDAQIPAMGRHNVYNALAAFLAGMEFGLEPPQAIAALRAYQPAGMRQKVVSHAGFTIVEDCYNASPDSMRAALQTLGNLYCDGRRIAVLSDMLELGEEELRYHREIGAVAAGCGIEELLCTGTLSQAYIEGAKAAGMHQARHFPGQDELAAYLIGTLKAGDVVWFKASRGMALEQLIENLYKEC